MAAPPAQASPDTSAERQSGPCRVCAAMTVSAAGGILAPLNLTRGHGKSLHIHLKFYRRNQRWKMPGRALENCRRFLYKGS